MQQTNIALMNISHFAGGKFEGCFSVDATKIMPVAADNMRRKDIKMEGPDELAAIIAIHSISSRKSTPPSINGPALELIFVIQFDIYIYMMHICT